MSYALTKEEIETGITIDYVDKSAYVFTNHAPTRRKLSVLAENFPEDVRVVKDIEYGLQIIVPLKWIKISPPKKRNMSDEEKQTLIKMLKEAKENKVQENAHDTEH